MLLTGTNLHESEQAQQLAQRYHAAGQPPACILMTVASGRDSAEILSGWRQKWWRLANAGSISTATFPRLKSRKRHSPPSLRWRQSLDARVYALPRRA
jgi:hypothetical protein